MYVMYNVHDVYETVHKKGFFKFGFEVGMCFSVISI